MATVSILCSREIIKRGEATSSLLISHYLPINASSQTEIMPWQPVSKLGEINLSLQTESSSSQTEPVSKLGLTCI